MNNEIYKNYKLKCLESLPDHSIHDEDVAKKSHDADHGVERSDGDGYDDPCGTLHGVLLGVVLSVRDEAHHVVRERDIEGDHGVEVRQLRSPGRGGRLHPPCPVAPFALRLKS